MTCIIQGPSCSGKTHLIKEFSKLCNKEIEIFDLSNESNLSLLTGQLATSSKINPNNISPIQKSLKIVINKNSEFKKIINNIKFNIDSPEEWTPNQFDYIIDELNKIQNNQKDKSIIDVLNLMKKERNFTNYLKDDDSLFIKSMTKGKWILLNGIELARPELFQKIMSLCDSDYCCLNLFEKGNDFKYSRNCNNEEGEKEIPNDFRLFITYNPFIVETSKRLSSGFLNKCLVFSTFPIEEDKSNVTFILSKSFEKNEI